MVLGLNLDQIAGILDSYFRSDLWPVLEGIDAACSVQIAVAGRSDVFTPPERARLGAVVAQRDNVTSTDFESSGHWVHVDAPEDLARSITANLI